MGTILTSFLVENTPTTVYESSFIENTLRMPIALLVALTILKLNLNHIKIMSIGFEVTKTAMPSLALAL
jgi:hypothetical protein